MESSKAPMCDSLAWIPELGIFALHGPDLSVRHFTPDQWREHVKGDKTLMAWAAYAMRNPQATVDYDMLPQTSSPRKEDT